MINAYVIRDEYSHAIKTEILTLYRWMNTKYKTKTRKLCYSKDDRAMRAI